jgi:hypothetical protein
MKGQGRCESFPAPHAQLAALRQLDTIGGTDDDIYSFTSVCECVTLDLVSQTTLHKFFK